MTIYEQFESTLSTGEAVSVLYSAASIEDGFDVQIEEVISEDKGDVIVPFGQEPDEYVSKHRLHEEARSHFYDRYTQK